MPLLLSCLLPILTVHMSFLIFTFHILVSADHRTSTKLGKQCSSHNKCHQCCSDSAAFPATMQVAHTQSPSLTLIQRLLHLMAMEMKRRMYVSLLIVVLRRSILRLTHAFPCLSLHDLFVLSCGLYPFRIVSKKSTRHHQLF